MDSAGSVSAIDLESGDRLWRVRMATPEEDSVVLGGGVAFADGLLYVTTGFGAVLAVDPANGGMSWRTQLSGPVRAAPHGNGGRVFAVPLHKASSEERLVGTQSVCKCKSPGWPEQ